MENEEISLEEEAESAPKVEEPYGDFMSLTEVNRFIGRFLLAAMVGFVILVLISL